MKSTARMFLCLCFALLLAYLASGQTQPAQLQAPTLSPQQREQLTALIKQQFGQTFSLPPKFPTPVITADFDSDGVEDIAIVADSKEPMPDSYAFKYQIGDPYNAYFGMGNPRISSTFKTSDPSHDHNILVIFGNGPDAWRAAVPKAKFVLINVPFDTIEVGRMLIKKNKPPVFAIKTREAHIMESLVWFDAKRKKWKWEPGDAVE